MNGYLLDTNVLSEVLKKRPNPLVLGRLEAVRHEGLATSAICVMELRFGAALTPDGDRLWKRISLKVLPTLVVLPIGEREGVLAGDLLADLEKRGRRIDTEDVLIAATALIHGLRVSSGNTRHFHRVRGLQVENWWQP